MAYSHCNQQNYPGHQKRSLIAHAFFRDGACNFVGHFVENHINLIPARIIRGSALIDEENNPADKNQKCKNANDRRGYAPERTQNCSKNASKEDSSCALNASKNCRGKGKNSQRNDWRKIYISYAKKGESSKESHVRLAPDAKSQVTVEYDENNKPCRIDTVVVSHQHNPDVDYDTIKKTIIEEIINPVLEPTGLLKGDTKYFINPTGKFVIGGPDGDSGLTGRKIIVDTYGGMGRHGGGAFSGKDPSKVDRSAAYMARYIAKNVVAAGLADRTEVELAYAIGVPFPVSILVETFGTEKVARNKIEAAVEKVFDCTPAGIIKTLNLKQPIYRKTASYGHFGREGFPWEKTDKIEALKAALQ